MSDDSDGRVITFPGGDHIAPPIPRYADTAGEPEAPETAPEIPTVPQFAPAASFLRSEGIPARPAADESEAAESGEGDYEDYGEYSERRSLAEVISDWLQFRIDSARADRDEHAPFREAHVADKVARLNAQTEREMSLAAQHNELRKAHVDARTALVAARGKGAAVGRGPEAGKGLTKGSQPGSAGGSVSRGSGGLGGSRDSGRTHGGQQRGIGDRDRHPGGPGKAPGGVSGSGRSGGASGGLSGRQNGPGDGDSRTPYSRGAERSRARQERRAARQAADLADRTADRAQDRQNRQTVWDERRAERTARRQARREGGTDGESPRTLAGLVAAELKRRRGGAEGKSGEDTASVKPSDPSVKPDEPSLTVDGPSLKVDQAGPKDQGVAEGPTGGPEADSQDAAHSDDTSYGGAATGDDWLSFLKDVFDKNPPGPGAPGPDQEPETVFAGNPHQAPGSAAVAEENIQDAEIVVDTLPAKGPAALGPAPEPHTERPGTTRPETRSASPTRARTVVRQRMAQEHRTNITFDEYLTMMANIAVNSQADYEMVKEAVENLALLASSLGAMANDLMGAHNISPKVTRMLADLADLAATTALQANRLAQESERAATVAVMAAQSVAKVYGEDMAAKEEAGLDQASAAVHHE